MFAKLLRVCGVVACLGLAGSSATDSSRNCCKICKESKACGDSCIARNQNCTKVGGCACNGVGPDGG